MRTSLSTQLKFLWFRQVVFEPASPAERTGKHMSVAWWLHVSLHSYTCFLYREWKKNRKTNVTMRSLNKKYELIIGLSNSRSLRLGWNKASVLLVNQMQSHRHRVNRTISIHIFLLQGRRMKRCYIFFFLCNIFWCSNITGTNTKLQNTVTIIPSIFSEATVLFAGLLKETEGKLLQATATLLYYTWSYCWQTMANPKWPVHWKMKGAQISLPCMS